METSREIYSTQRADAVSYCIPLSPRKGKIAGKDLASGVLGEQEEAFRFCCVENTLSHMYTHSLTHTCTQMYSHIPSLACACSHTYTHALTHTYILTHAHTHNLILTHTYVTKCSLHFLNLKSGRDSEGYGNLKPAQSLQTGNQPGQTKADVCDVKNTGEELGRWLSS